MKLTRVVKNVTAFVKPILLIGVFLVLAYLVLACLGYLAPFLPVEPGSLALYLLGCFLIFLVFARKRSQSRQSAEVKESDASGPRGGLLETGEDAPEDLDEVRERIRIRKGRKKGRR